MRFNLILAQTSIALYFGGRSLWLEKIKKGDIALRAIIAVFGICCEGRSLSHSIAPMRSVKILVKVNSF